MAAKGHVSRDVYLVSGQTASHFTVEEYRLPTFVRILMIAIFTARIERPSSFSMILPSLLASLPWNGTRVDPTAAVEQGYS